MLIIDSGHELVQGDTVKLPWKGLLAFYHLPDVGKSLEPGKTQDGALPVEFTFTTPPSSTLSALRDIIVASARSPAARPSELLLFASRTADSAKLSKALKAVEEQVDILHFALDDDGELAILACGRNVVLKPDFVRFFTNMVPGLDRHQTQVSLDMMKMYLGAEANA